MLWFPPGNQYKCTGVLLSIYPMSSENFDNNSILREKLGFLRSKMGIPKFLLFAFNIFISGDKMSEEAKEEMGLPVLGKKAPDFEAVTTQGTLRLSDYEGIWLVLFSHPADFTPVCTTEFIAFSEIYEELKKKNTELLGLSVDSVSSHSARI